MPGNMTLPTIDAANGAYRERPIQLERAAVLVVDMQNMECGARLRHQPDSKKHSYYRRLDAVVIPNQQRLLGAARAHGMQVIYTVIESLTQDGRDRSLDHKISRIHAPKGSWDAIVIDEVAPVGDEIIIPKTSSGIFNSTNIDYVLRNLGIAYLIVCGVVTDQCVESAIRDAADRGYLVTQVEDACAAEDADRHDVSIAAMRGHYCRTRTTDAMLLEIAQLFDAAGQSNR